MLPQIEIYSFRWFALNCAIWQIKLYAIEISRLNQELIDAK